MFIVGSAALIAGRVVGTAVRRRMMRRGIGGLPTLVIGAGPVGRLTVQRLQDRAELGLRPIGFLDRDPPDDDHELPVLGASWDLERVVAEHDVGLVIVTFSTAPHEVLLRLVRRCRALGVEVALVPRLYEEITNRTEVEHLGGLALLRSPQPDTHGWQFAVKYAADRVVATVALVLLLPVMAGCALAVRLSSPGPVLFRQTRAGLDGREFAMLKFRTMRGTPGAHGEADARWRAEILGEEPPAAAPARTDRTTGPGRLMRRWGLDELPQLLNIAKGDMSFVGPRPERLDYVNAFAERVPRYGERHRVKAGLTGWAQIHGLRGETSLADRVEWDNHYIENWSLWLDLKIVLLTVPAVIRAAREITTPR
jgi:exopolysaccharide biosynthesis polyprenyl glycosylphosphotransferase